MRTRRLLNGLVAAVTLGGAGLAWAGDKVELKYRLEVGKKYYLRMRADEKITQEMLGQKQEMEQTLGFEHALVPTAVDAAGITAQITFERVVFRQKGATGSVDYDSKDAPTDVPPAARSMAALAGFTLTVQWRPNGEIVEVTGVQELLEAVLEQIPDDAAGAQLRERIKDQLSADGMIETVSDVLVVLPDEPVAAGDTWSHRVTLSKELGLSTETTYTLKEVRGRRAVVAVVAKVSSDPDKTLAMGPLKARSNLKGEQRGSVEIDLDTGLPVKGDAQGAINGELTMTGGPDAPGGGELKVPMKIELRTRLSGGKSRAESDESERDKAGKKSAG